MACDLNTQTEAARTGRRNLGTVSTFSWAVGQLLATHSGFHSYKPSFILPTFLKICVCSLLLIYLKGRRIYIYIKRTICLFISQMPIIPGLGQAKAWSQELYLDLPRGRQRFKASGHRLLPPRYTSRCTAQGTCVWILGTPIQHAGISHCISVHPYTWSLLDSMGITFPLLPKALPGSASCSMGSGV